MTHSWLCFNYLSRWFLIAATMPGLPLVALSLSLLHRRPCREVKTTFTLLAILFIPLATAPAQVAPAATVPGGLPAAGNFHYAFRYSQSAQFGSDLGDWQTSTPSVSLDYGNENQQHPFSLNYSGGYTWTLTGPTYSTGLFQHLLLSQGFEWRKWNVRVSDDVSYRPQAPLTGFSGIPGIGEPIGAPSPNPPPTQNILTLNSRVVQNSLNGEIGHSLKYRSSLSAGGGADLLRYPDGDGLDTDTHMATAGLTWGLNARNSASFDYRFYQFSYPDFNVTFLTNTGFFGFHRTWNRKVSSDISAGPQWTSSSDSTGIPSSIGVAVDAAVNYQFRSASAGLSYSRGTNGGSGYQLGSESDVVNANFSRQFGNNLNVGAEAGYRHTTGLRNDQVINSEYGGAQASRRIGRFVSVFANYTAMNQSSSAPLPSSALHQLLHVVGFGIEYSPRELHLKP